MSDARAATDAELLASLRAFVEQHRNGGDAPANVMRVMTLLHRLLDDNAADAARIRELEARQVPDGWQVVPKEPTRAMHDASNEVLGMPWRSVVPPGISHDDYMRKLEWAAMLAAAPRP